MSQLDELGISTGILYELPSPKNFRTLLTALGDIVSEVTLKFNENGLYICEYPLSTDIVITVNIDPKKLEHHYEIKNGESFKMTFEATQLIKYISVLPNELPTIMYYDYNQTESPCMHLKSVDKSGGHTGSGRINTLNESEVGDLDVEFPALFRVELQATEFLRLINNMTSIGGQRGKMELKLSIGGDESEVDYVEINVLDENNPQIGWNERFESVTTDLTAREKYEHVPSTPITTIDCNDDPCNQESFDLISRQDDVRPKKRRRFETNDTSGSKIEFSNMYRVYRFKCIGKIVSMASTVELVFIKLDIGTVAFTIQMDVPNLGTVVVMLSDMENE